MPDPAPGPVLRLGISSCLLGEQVRFDGGHKRDDFLAVALGRFVEWVPVCPEVEVGLGAPRERMRLVGDPAAPRLIALPSQTDLTTRMATFAKRRARELAGMDLDGFVLKFDSPSCGLHRVRVYDESGMPQRKGRGIFAQHLVETNPELPVEEEGRLKDPGLRETFVERLFAHHRWRALRAAKPKARDLIAFHAAHKMTLLAHAPQAYRDLGRLVAGAGTRPIRAVLDEYGIGFAEAMTKPATRSRHVNTLQHLAGMLRREIDDDDRSELADTIEAFRQGRVPLIVPVTLLKHHLRRTPVEWAVGQTYLDPFPAELALRATL